MTSVHSQPGLILLVPLSWNGNIEISTLSKLPAAYTSTWVVSTACRLKLRLIRISWLISEIGSHVLTVFLVCTPTTAPVTMSDLHQLLQQLCQAGYTPRCNLSAWGKQHCPSPSCAACDKTRSGSVLHGKGSWNYQWRRRVWVVRKRDAIFTPPPVRY